MTTPLKALILEDRPTDVELMLRQLARDGFEVQMQCVQDASGYLAALDRESWNVILTDYSMPKYNALLALEVLQQRGLDIPFLVVTGSISEEVAVECIKKGAADYLLKDRLTRLGTAVGNALVVRKNRQQQRLVEETLRESESKLRAIIECSRDAIGLSKRGVHIFANPAYLSLFGYPNNESLVGASILNHIAPSHRQQVHDKAERRAAGEQASTLYETRGMKASGSEFDMEVSVSTYEAHGEIYTVANIRDITERKRNQALLVESEKLRTVAGLAAGVAHEINNPLGSMVQNAQVIANRLTQDVDANQQAARRQGISLDKVHGFIQDRGILEMLESIRRSGESASQIVRNLLTYSRRDVGTSRVDLRELVEQTLQLAANDYELKQFNGLASVEVMREFAPDTPIIACNPGQMKQVLLNLIRNAVQAMHARPESAHARLCLRTSRQADCGCIEVEDNGPGIAPELRPRLFEPFVTTKPVGQGTGLGLFVCYHLVTVTHGGQLSVTSTPGKKTCFTVRLPLKESQGVA